ncbi:MAG: hypothetical protein IKI93_15310 [Clostridia bacterium]|nr:hypothetical protein [Clostridia bacterium]
MMEVYEKYVGLIFDNRYRIERVVGVGGMAIVFKATDLLMRRPVAVKILKDEISADEQSVKCLRMNSVPLPCSPTRISSIFMTCRCGEP